MSEPTRYRVANNQAQLTLGGGILAVDPAGPLVMYDDYAELRMERIHDLNQIGGLQEENSRLKADVNELADGLKLASEVGIKIADEVTRLKSEVERLNTGIQPEGSNDAVGRAVNVLLEKEKEIARLKAEVERLRKAGDGLHAFLINYIVDSRISSAYLNKLDDGWLAAKEGKQS